MAGKLRHVRGLRDVWFSRMKELKEVADLSETDETHYSIFQIRYRDIDNIANEFTTQQLATSAQAASLEEDITNDELIRKNFDTMYYATKDIYERIFDSPADRSIQSVVSTKSPSIKLPKINLPKFDGSYKDWPSFFDLFNVVIHNNPQLSDIEKFQYLRSNLSGSALSTIKSLQITDDNYEIAYRALVDRFQNPRSLASAYWQEIVDFPKVQGDCSQNLRKLLECFSENLDALKNLNLPVDQWSFVLFHILIKKVENDTVKRFELQYAKTSIPTYSELVTFLKSQCTALENIGKQNTQKYSKSSNANRSTSLCTNSEATIDASCPLCNSKHSLTECQHFLHKIPVDRYNFAKEKQLCLNCLKPFHRSSNCTSSFKCKLCHAKHHSLLHFTSRSNKIRSDTGVPNSKQIASSSSSSELVDPSSDTNLSTHSNPVALACLSEKENVLLGTAVVEVRDSSGHFQKVRCLLDTGSQSSFLTTTCCNRLGLRKHRLSFIIHGLDDMSKKSTCGTRITLKPRNKISSLLSLDVLLVPKICCVPSSYIPLQKWPHISDITLADPEYNIPSHVDCLIGSDLLPDILLDGTLRGHTGQPMALNTIFGYVLVGKIKVLPAETGISLCINSIDSSIKKFWDIEEIPASIVMSPKDLQCEKHFIETFSRDSSGRYMVCLPFKQGMPSFVDSKVVALRRLASLERRLQKNPSLLVAYSAFLKDYLDMGHMSLVPSLNSSKLVYYIPHHPVFKSDTRTTNLRVVFDASSFDSNHISLNQTLLTGPKLQQDLVSILLHFRMHRFVFTADIRQMYRQILVQPHQRDYQRILWRFNFEKAVQEYQLNTVTYGVVSSPYLAIRTLLQLAKDEGLKFPNAAKVLTSDIYVDDIITGSDSIENIMSLQTELISLLERGRFELRKWASNDSRLLTHIPSEFCQQESLEFESKEEHVIKILGIIWSPHLDVFSYKVDILNRPCTKRNILSDLARIFDPLGFLTPTSFLAKYYMQYLWTMGLDWDQEPDPHFVSRWIQFKNKLSDLSALSLPRYISVNTQSILQVHGFCDASERGFAAVVYFRIEGKTGNISTPLIMAKSKVAPLKRVCLARLELCGAALLASLIDFILKSMKDSIKVSKVIAWCDSSVALSWIRSSPHRWQTFVANRVSQIQDKVPPSDWRHVPSKDNPADCASRGISPSVLITHDLWWSGPSWLRHSEELWPTDLLVDINVQEVSKEERKVTLTNSLSSFNFVHDLLNRFSTLGKVKRIIGYLLRYIFNIKSKWKNIQKRCGPFTILELQQAELVLVKCIQASSFEQEICDIRNKVPLSKPMRKLCPFLDERGLLRVGGRLVNSSLSFDQKHPILLPQKHRFTQLLILDYHLTFLHPGVQTLRFLILENYWIINAKRAIRNVLSSCVRCFRFRPTSTTPLMGNLPSLRVNQSKPFACVGVDFCGPFTMTHSKIRGAKTYKAYISVFVCFATKAIHLELCSELSSEAFLAALRRFIGRRGRCSVLHSDCGTNFQGANRYIREIFQNAVDTEHIEWRFNPPSSPHFGGLWEAGVKSVKGHLLRIVGEQCLTFEEMSTVLVQIEALLNSRPILELSNDPNDLSALTPGHFLTLEPLSVLPDPNCTHLAINRLSRWQLLQRIHQHFWKRWHTDYLHTLMQRQKWTKHCPQIKVGQLVLLKDDNLPPMKWRLGRVCKLHSGTDGVCRVVTVRTIHGSSKRPVVKICPLPQS